MKRYYPLVALLGLAPTLQPARADSIWDRRNPEASHLFNDTRARRQGDLLTIQIRESTLFDGKEDRQMHKNTNLASVLSLKGSSSDETTSRTFAGSLDGLATSQRQFDGKSDYKSDRNFTDRMTVRVVAVEPNGDLVIEGFRTRVVARENRVLRVTGIVRPVDIGPGNVVLSQYIANFEINYVGKGTESQYLNNGWLGTMMNYVWPF